MKSKTAFIIDKYSKGDTPALLIKTLVGLMVALMVVMIFYYVFLHRDEVLQTAGTAVDAPLSNPDEDTYGYEITAQDVRNTAQPVAPEYEAPVGEEIPEMIDNQEVPLHPQVAEEPSHPEPQTPAANEPQLME